MFKGFLKNVGAEKQSKEIAKERLKLVLTHERVQLTPEKFAKMREEIIEVIKKYIDIDVEDTNVSVKSDSSSTAFILNAKVIKVK
jgi:cell division topological specificity factor